MATKLKNMRLTSVDMVRAGANQEADICLFKSADPAEATESPTEEEKNIFKRFLNFIRKGATERENEPETSIEKDYSTFDMINSRRENNDKLWRYTDALTCSIRSIQEDNDLDEEEKLKMMHKSLDEFDAAMEELMEDLCKIPHTRTGEIVAEKSAGTLDYLFDEIEDEILKANPYHDALGRFTTGGGGGGAAGSGAKFDAKAAEDKLNEIGLRRINGGSKNDDYKVLGETLHSAPVGTVFTETGNRGVKFQYTKTKEGTSKRDDEWEDEDGNKRTSHNLSMTWGGYSAGSHGFKFDTADTAPTKDEVRESRTNAVNGQLRQWLGGKSADFDEIEEL